MGINLAGHHVGPRIAMKRVMKVFRRDLLVVLLLVLASPSLVGAMELEFVPNDAIRDLVHEFERAGANSPQLDLSGVWSCDLYGAQSRLQVKRGVLLYQFSTRRGNAIENEGAHPIKSYTYKSEGSLRTYVGSNGSLQDEVRLGSSGGLVTRLISKGSNEKVKVIAFSRCRKKV